MVCVSLVRPTIVLSRSRSVWPQRRRERQPIATIDQAPREPTERQRRGLLSQLPQSPQPWREGLRGAFCRLTNKVTGAPRCRPPSRSHESARPIDRPVRRASIAKLTFLTRHRMRDYAHVLLTKSEAFPKIERLYRDRCGARVHKARPAASKARP
jgi:hypothetical protein